MTTLLPKNATTAVDVRIVVDGVLDESVSGTMIPSEVGQISYEVRGSSSSVIYVEVGGQIWRKYDVNFVTEKISFAAGTYTPSSTEPATSPSSEPDSEPTETPATEPTMAPVQTPSDTVNIEG